MSRSSAQERKGSKRSDVKIDCQEVFIVVVAAVARRQETSICLFELVPGISNHRSQTGCGELGVGDETNQGAADTWSV